MEKKNIAIIQYSGKMPLSRTKDITEQQINRKQKKKKEKIAIMDSPGMNIRLSFHFKSLSDN